MASNPFTALATRIKHMPIWIFHGGADEVVPVEQSRQLIAALKQAGATIRHTEFAGASHVAGAEQAYADPEMSVWLLSHRRKH